MSTTHKRAPVTGRRSRFAPDNVVPLAAAARQRGSDVAGVIRAVALDLFADRNYSTVTIKEIAKATGVNSSLIYYYFASKEDLFLSVVESTVEEAFTIFEAQKANIDDAPETVIAAWVEIHVLQFVLLQKLARMSLDYAATRQRTARIDRAIRKFYDLESAVLGKCIRDGIRRGEFRSVDPAQVTTFISTFLDGSLFRAVMFPNFRHKAAIRHMLKLVLGHLRREQPAREAAEAAR